MASYGLKVSGGDVVWSGGVLERLTDPVEAVRQRLELRLAMSTGEWFLDPEEGMPYMEKILGKPRSEWAVRQAIQDRILGTAGVKDVLSLVTAYDGRTRALTVSYVAQADVGQVAGTLAVS